MFFVLLVSLVMVSPLSYGSQQLKALLDADTYESVERDLSFGSYESSLVDTQVLVQLDLDLRFMNTGRKYPPLEGSGESQQNSASSLNRECDEQLEEYKAYTNNLPADQRPPSKLPFDDYAVTSGRGGKFTIGPVSQSKSSSKLPSVIDIFAKGKAKLGSPFASRKTAPDTTQLLEGASDKALALLGEKPKTSPGRRADGSPRKQDKEVSSSGKKIALVLGSRRSRAKQQPTKAEDLFPKQADTTASDSPRMGANRKTHASKVRTTHQRRRSQTNPPLPTWRKDKDTVPEVLVRGQQGRLVRSARSQSIEAGGFEELYEVESSKTIDLKVFTKEHRDQEWVANCCAEESLSSDADTLFRMFMQSDFFSGAHATLVWLQPDQDELGEHLVLLAQELFPQWLKRYKEKIKEQSPRSVWQSVQPSPEVTRSKKKKAQDSSETLLY